MRFTQRFKKLNQYKFDIGIEYNDWLEVVRLEGEDYRVANHYYRAIAFKFGVCGFAFLLKKYKEKEMEPQIAQSINATLKKMAAL